MRFKSLLSLWGEADSSGSQFSSVPALAAEQGKNLFILSLVQLLKTLLGLVTWQGGICLQEEKFLQILQRFIQQQLAAECVINTRDLGMPMASASAKLSKYTSDFFRH